MTNSLQRFGYATLVIDNIRINSHEFHKSDVELKEKKVFDVEKIDVKGEKKEWNCGYKRNKTIGTYNHVHFFGNLEFLEFLFNN